MQYIYARVSTDQQDTLNQLNALQAQFPEVCAVFAEACSGASREKPALAALMALIRPGDTLIVAALDRLGRRLQDAINLIEGLYARGIKVVSVREALDYSTPHGKLVSQIMLSVAELERELIRGRIKTALAAKKAEAKRTGNGWSCGRRPRYSQRDWTRVAALRASGLTLKQVASQTGISAARICRYLKAA